MRSYDEAIAEGAAEYADVLQALDRRGLPATFTQTGGMNAAIEVVLEAGFTLLVTDAEDSLAWERTEHRGWAVGLYRGDLDDLAVTLETAEDSSVEALEALVKKVLHVAEGNE